MDSLWLSPELARQIAAHATAESPREACGFIGGIGAQAKLVIATDNVAATPQTAYEVAPRDLVEAVRQFQANGLEWIGIYHSHPCDPPAPSATDLALAYYPNMAYLIVSLKAGEPELAAWRIASGVADRLPLHISNEPPPVDAGAMSRAQQVAVILSAILAVAVFLAIALSLLPPAPRIP